MELVVEEVIIRNSLRRWGEYWPWWPWKISDKWKAL